MNKYRIPLVFFFICYLAIGQSELSTDSTKFYYKILQYPEDEDDIFKAFRFYSKQQETHLNQGDTLGAISDLRQIAIAQNKLGLYHESETTAVKAIQLLSHLPDNATTKEAFTGLFNQLGRIYKALLDFERAVEFYDKALSYTQDENYRNIIKNNKAVIYKELGEFELAEKEFLEIYESSKLEKNTEQINRAMDNLAFVQAKLNRDGAIQDLRKAMDSRRDSKDVIGLYSSYRNLSIYYLDRDKQDSAQYYGTLALELAEEINSPSFLMDAMQLMIGINGDSLSKSYMALNDSLSKQKQLQENKYALIKYNYYEQEQKAQEQALEAKNEKLKRRWYQAGGALILLSIIPLYLYVTDRNKRRTMAKVYETEGKISKKVHDEVANDVYKMMARIQSESFSPDHALDHLEKIYNKTRDISKSISVVSHEDSFTEILKDLFSSYHSDHVSIITTGLKEVKVEDMNVIKKEAIYRVLQELLTNMKKYSMATLVVLKFEQKSGKIKIEYADNGEGCVLNKSNGLHNAENRIRDINGTITFDTSPGNGFKATIIV